MIKSVEDLRDDLAIKEAEAEFWLDAKTDAAREQMIAHLRFIQVCQEADHIRRELIVAGGEST